MTRRIIINRAVDNGPTPERVAKGDYETVKEHGRAIHRKSDVLGAMLRSGQISGEHVSAAGRWHRDFVLATTGTLEVKEMRDDFLADEASWQRELERSAAYRAAIEQGYRHDAVSWGVMRGKASCRLSVVREAIRKPGEDLLKMLLIDQLTLENMASAIMPCPQMAGYNGARIVKGQCAFVLRQLEDIYRAENRSAFDVCYLPRDAVVRKRRAMAECA